MECGWITDRQIEAARIAMTRSIKRGGKVWIRMFPDKPITKKPAETRMGKGKGAPEEWVAVVRPGKILFEMEGVPLDIATEAMRLAAHKLPMPTKFVSRGEIADGVSNGDEESRKLRDLDDNEMRNQLREMRGAAFRLKFQMRMGQTDGLKKTARACKKDRARMLTILRRGNKSWPERRKKHGKRSKANTGDPGSQERESRRSRFDQDGQDHRGRSQPPRSASHV